MDDPMEAADRPYVDPATEPRDAGTEPWADATPATGHPTKRRPDADPVAPSEESAAIEGLPADEFATNEEALGARDKNAVQPTGD